MTLLILGLLLWASVHFIPSLAIPLQIKWKTTLGENGYKISFALLMVLSLVMIVFGWRSISPTLLYLPAEASRPITIILMVIAFLLFGASHSVTRIKKLVRHPQLTSVIVWSIAHLLSNGENRSVVLFGSLGAWALLEIFAINRREGPQGEVSIPSWLGEIKGIAISLVIFSVVVFAHPYIAGVALK